MFDLYTGILKMTVDFRDDGKDISIKYLLDANYDQLFELYQINEIAGTKNDFNKALNLLNWISSNIYHYGNYNNHITNTALDLFKYAFGKGEKYGINCRSLSLALTECLLAIGIKARTIYIMPYSPYDFDNHVVCEAWIVEMDKWVMFDPTYNLFASYNKIPLNVIEIRSLLADQKEVIFNKEANYNRQPINKDELVTYYAKDLFRFMLSDIQGSDSESIEGRRMINIAPYGYDITKFTLANIDFRIKMMGNNKNMQKWRKAAEEDIIIYKGLELLDKPE